MADVKVGQTVRSAFQDATKNRSLRLGLASIAVIGVVAGSALLLRSHFGGEAKASVAEGDALFQKGQHKQALAAYARALAHDRSAQSEQMRDNLAACFNQACRAQAANLITRYKLVTMEKHLEPLTRAASHEVRLLAIVTLEKIGRADKLDYFNVFRGDLDAPSCEVRRHAVARLGKLGGERALTAIRNARAKEKAETPWYKPDCIGSGRAADAERQIVARR